MEDMVYLYADLLSPLVRWRALTLNRYYKELNYPFKYNSFIKQVIKLEKIGLIKSQLRSKISKKHFTDVQPKSIS